MGLDVRLYRVDSTAAIRDQSCEDAQCANFELGWVTLVDESTELGQRQAAYIRKTCRSVTAAGVSFQDQRRYKETLTVEGWTEFRFPAGQSCFTKHTRREPERDTYTLGTRGRRIHTVDSSSWVDDFGENQEHLADIHERG